MKRLRSNAGTVFSGLYLFLFLILTIVGMIGSGDSMAGVPLIFFTMPWSVLLLMALDGVLPDSQIIFFVVTAFSALVNAVILYFSGFLLSLAYHWLNKTFKVFDE